jgi:YfiH family protein
MSRTLFTSRFGGDLKDPAQREKLRASLSLGTLHFMRQTHSDRVIVVEEAVVEEAVVEEAGEELECDALITSSKSVGIAALAADCMPITFSAVGLVGVAHVGRVGLVNGIAQKVVDQMREMGAAEIKAVIGPSICGDCYEVSPTMYEEVIALMPATATSRERRALDLQRGVTAQLHERGVAVRNIGICTLESPAFFSFRGGDLQMRQAGLISL